MKVSTPEVEPGKAGKSFRILNAFAICILAVLATIQSYGQAPGLVWTANVGATLFAVDANTNVYANSGGAVIKLNGAGQPLQTNTICPIPGLARRDAAGNFYFAGNFDGTQNFGGITLVGGWTNSPFPPWQWRPGYPTHFVAKYDSAGVLQWVNSFGNYTVTDNRLTDLLVDSTGAVYAGHIGGDTFGSGQPWITRLSNTGLIQWSGKHGLFGGDSTVKLGGLTASNCLSMIRNAVYELGFGRISTDGVVTSILQAPPAEYPLSGTTSDSTNTKPVMDNLGRAIIAGRCQFLEAGCSGQRYLRKYELDGTNAWSVVTSLVDQWVLARDNGENIYLGGSDGLFALYDTNGSLHWTNNYGKKIVTMLVDGSDNRFVGFADGSIARIGPDLSPLPPEILSGPQGQTLFTGSNITLTASATGSLPLQYRWRFNGTDIPDATNSVLTLNNLGPTQSGYYSVVVTNAGGSVTSAPALVRIKSVQFFLGDAMLTNGTYSFQIPPTLSILTAFTNGSSFFTLDGSAPTFASTSYTAPFVVQSNATVRALGYSADFSQSEEADPVTIVLPAQRILSTSTIGPGSITLNPPGGLYPASSVVTAFATPSPGWTFLYWKGDAFGTSQSTSVTMDQDKSIQAVFGTTLSTTVAGSGQVLVYPPGGIYPYGTTVRLTGVPQPGNYFGVWGNAASGTANPLYFTLTNANPTVSSLFVSLSAGQAALTILINGPGTFQVTPAGNVFSIIQTVNLTATPLAGQGFINWSGDATGTQNPLSVAMTQSRIVTANFTNWPVLVANQQSLTPEGFRLSVLSGTGLVYKIQGSTNLGNWTDLGVITNTAGQSYFTDPAGTNSPMRFYRGTAWP